LIIKNRGGGHRGFFVALKKSRDAIFDVLLEQTTGPTASNVPMVVNNKFCILWQAKFY